MQIAFSINKKNLFSKFIAWMTDSKWSHCFIVVCPIGLNDSLIAESSMLGGVKFNLLSKYQDGTHDIELFDISNDCSPSDLDSILPLIGHMYGYTQAIGYLIAKVLHLKTNPFTDNVVCSELVYLFLFNTKLKALIKDLDPNEVTPEQLYERLKNG